MEDGIAMLVDPQGYEYETLTDEEYRTLKETLITVRVGGWLPRWWQCQINAIARGTVPGDRHPTPVQLAATLVLDAKEFTDKLRTARELYRQRPDLFHSDEGAAEGRPNPTGPRLAVINNEHAEAENSSTTVDTPENEAEEDQGRSA